MVKRLHLLFFFSALPCLAEPVFVSPNDALPLLKREKIPLDVAAMYDIGADLAVLASQPGPNTAEKLRQRAKTLTLSQRLHPTYPKTRRLLENLTEGNFTPTPKKHSTKVALEKLSTTATWLIDLPESSEGHRLGLMILDILPEKHPLAAQRDSSKEDQRWNGTIASLAAFKNVQEEPEAEPEPPKPEKALAYKETALSTHFPFSGFHSKSGKPRTSVQTITLAISEGNNSLRFAPALHRQPPRVFLRPILTFFKKLELPLPREHELFIDTSGLRYGKENKNNILTPMALMLDAALSGRPLRDNTILFAGISPDGTLSPLTLSWSLLKALETSDLPRGSRLIVPPSIAADLQGFTLVAQPEFFLKFEILSAATFEEARNLFYQDVELSSEDNSAFQAFQDVLEKAPQTNLARFLKFSGVKERLKLATQSPSHLSAKLLLSPASTRFPRAILVHEITHHLQSYQTLNLSKHNKRTLKAEHTRIRELLQTLLNDNRVDIHDREIITEALNINKKLTGIGRTIEEQFQTEQTHLALEELRDETSTFLKKIKNSVN